jgi:hypothetical protein
MRTTAVVVRCVVVVVFIVIAILCRLCVVRVVRVACGAGRCRATVRVAAWSRCCVVYSSSPRVFVSSASRLRE